MESQVKKYKIKTPGFYFIYIKKQNPMFKDQTEKFATLFNIDGILITELNTEANKVNGISRFTHKQTIQWFDSILNPIVKSPRGIKLPK